MQWLRSIAGEIDGTSTNLFVLQRFQGAHVRCLFTNGLDQCSGRTCLCYLFSDREEDLSDCYFIVKCLAGMFFIKGLCDVFPLLAFPF